MAECPTCGREDFQSEYGMKKHHSMVHGESIPGEIVECSNCGEEFREEKQQRVEKQDHHFCSDSCFSNWMSQRTGNDHPLYNMKDVECDVCGSVVERTPSTLEMTMCFVRRIVCQRSSHVIERGIGATCGLVVKKMLTVQIVVKK
jgi:endogenous inhibitor of DNA gyrase (YacG/DUF329 family)